MADKIKLMVATPMYGGQCYGNYTQSMIQLAVWCKEQNIDFYTHFLGNESLIQRARNYCAQTFLDSDATHLLFIDSDIKFTVNSVGALLEKSIVSPDAVVCGPYVKKGLAWDKVLAAMELHGQNPALKQGPGILAKFAGSFVFNFLPSDTDVEIDVTKPFQVAEAGTGFMLIPRSALEKMAAAYPERSYTPDHVGMAGFDGARKINAFFDCVIDEASNRFLSEDYYFCRQYRAIGGEIWMVPSCATTHTGTYEYQGEVGLFAQIENYLNQTRGA